LLETAREVDAGLARADLEIRGEQRLRARRLVEAHPDVVAPLALGLRAHAQGRLVPAVLDDALGARGVLGPGRLTGFHPMRDAHHVTRDAAVHEEALDRAAEVPDVTGAEDLDELVPARDAGGHIERSFDRETDEGCDARVLESGTPLLDAFDRGVYAGRSELPCGTSHLSTPFRAVGVQPRRRASLISPLMRAISRSQICRSSCSIPRTSSRDQWK